MPSCAEAAQQSSGQSTWGLADLLLQAIDHYEASVLLMLGLALVAKSKISKSKVAIFALDVTIEHVGLGLMFFMALYHESSWPTACFIGSFVYFALWRPMTVRSAAGPHKCHAQKLIHPDKRERRAPPRFGAFQKSADPATQVQQIVTALTPMPHDERLARRLEQKTKRCIAGLVPEAKVAAIPAGNSEMLAASGAHLEYEMVVTVAPGILAERIRQLPPSQKGRDGADSPQASQFSIKAATRMICERLRFARLWRTQLSSPECKIVLVVPQRMQLSEHPILISLYVNYPYPLRMQSLLSQGEAGRKELIMFVMHWVRERCVSNVGRGQLTRYAWATLVCYFCEQSPDGYLQSASTLECFQAFATFYAEWFELDAVPAITFTGKVHMPTEKLMFNLPYIQDPLDTAQDLAINATADGFDRVKSELQRARDILLSHDRWTVVSELCQKWKVN